MYVCMYVCLHVCMYGICVVFAPSRHTHIPTNMYVCKMENRTPTTTTTATTTTNSSNDTNTTTGLLLLLLLLGEPPSPLPFHRFCPGCRVCKCGSFLLKSRYYAECVHACGVKLYQ
eukprot:NODE_2832_length_735_cov_65.772595_g1996_i0.p2 GENE.NODE_2832_length_735_cov_65.772595_g1996_i0~~NODE_2832_length_735_cov_65.772595_g1996_i0.p2  ORF type:complete len:116 (+),score=14.77 NODE_2832_length_735_cov_65.772595_g1996_i0:3-350(+)